MLQFNPNDPGDTPHKLNRDVKESGMTLQQICDQLNADYDVDIIPSALGHSIRRGAIRLQRALQIPAVCGVTEIEINREINPPS